MGGFLFEGEDMTREEFQFMLWRELYAILHSDLATNTEYDDYGNCVFTLDLEGLRLLLYQKLKPSKEERYDLEEEYNGK